MGIVGGAAAAPAWGRPPEERLALAAAARPAAAATGAAATGPMVAGVVDVTRMGAVGDGRTLTTAALQRAIDACGAAGGGMVLVPAGKYLTGALFLRSHVHLYLAAGATLVASQRPEDFPPIKGREEGIERSVHASVLTGVDLEYVAITGQGMIDGQGMPWWAAYEETRQLRLAAKLPREAPDPPNAPLKWPRPRMINLQRCKDALIEGLTFRDSPGPNVHLLYCQDVVVSRIASFQTQWARCTDGVLVDSSRRVKIIDCRMSSGADCVGIKSGYNEDGRRVNIPSEDVLISGCHMFKMSCGVVLGSEIAGGIRNVVITNCVMRECLSGVRIRAPRGRGGVVENVRATNLVIDRVEEMGVKLSNFFDSMRSEGRFIKTESTKQNLEMARSVKAPVNEGTPTFRDITFSGITFTHAREVAMVEGLPERFIRRVVFEDITVARSHGGITCTNAAEIGISNLTIESLEMPAVDAREVERLEVHRLKCTQPPTQAPLIFMENVASALIHGCNVGDGTRSFEWLKQQACRDVTVTSNHIAMKQAATKPTTRG